MFICLSVVFFTLGCVCLCVLFHCVSVFDCLSCCFLAVLFLQCLFGHLVFVFGECLSLFGCVILFVRYDDLLSDCMCMFAYLDVCYVLFPVIMF